MDCIFCKIANKEIPKDFIYEDSEIMVFDDIHPIKKVHILTMPKKHISDLLNLEEEKLLTKLMFKIKDLVKKYNLEDNGYRLVVNGGGAQEIDHLHIHLMGPMGRAIGMS